MTFRSGVFFVTLPIARTCMNFVHPLVIFGQVQYLSSECLRTSTERWRRAHDVRYPCKPAWSADKGPYSDAFITLGAAFFLRRRSPSPLGSRKCDQWSTANCTSSETADWLFPRVDVMTAKSAGGPATASKVFKVAMPSSQAVILRPSFFSLDSPPSCTSFLSLYSQWTPLCCLTKV